MKRKLPEEGTPEYLQLCRDVINLGHKGAAQNFHVGIDCVRHNVPHGKAVQVVGNATPTELEVQYLPYPEFELKPFRIGKPTRDEEDIGIVFADHHEGRKTPSYNSEIYQQRMDNYLESAMDIINLHRPIRRAHVLNVGDTVQGENIYQGSNMETVEMSARRQIRELAVPTISRFLVSLAQGVEEVWYYSAPGNHGIYERVAPEDTNWDLFASDALYTGLNNQKRIHVIPADDWCQLVLIHGYRFFIWHGDGITAHNGIPLFAMKRRLQEWYAHFEGFHYAYCGHWHTGAYDWANEKADFTICPPMVTGDSWALKKVGRASKPIQLLFGVHPHYGRTWEYKIYCDKSFVPQPFNREESDGTIGQ